MHWTRFGVGFRETGTARTWYSASEHLARFYTGFGARQASYPNLGVSVFPGRSWAVASTVGVGDVLTCACVVYARHGLPSADRAASPALARD
jgi:hypothetical protein